MASGGHNNQNNPSGRNPPPPTGGQWNVNRARNDDGDHWNQAWRNISNNLLQQDWQPVNKDAQSSNKNERRSKSGKNVEIAYTQEAPSDSVEVFHLDSAVQSVPRTKFTTGSTAPHRGMNGARRKVVHRDEGSSGDASERLRYDPKWDDRQSSQTGSRNVVKKSSPVGDTAKDKFTNLPNANQIMVRLHQIRDYMSQVVTMMETLQKSDDPQVVDRLSKLESVLGDLQYSEHQLVELLDKVSRNNRGQIVKFSRLLNHLQAQEHEYVNILQNMALRPENGIPPAENESDASSEDSDEESEESVVQEVNSEASDRLDKEAEDQTAEAAHILRRNELMKKMLESQEKLKALQDQQAALLTLQHKAENRLAEARAFRNQLMDSPKDTGGPGPPVADVQTNSSNVLQDDLENLQARLNVLRDMYDNRQRAESLSRSEDPSHSKEADEVEDSAAKEREELQNKLQDLQQKKRHMDDLLQELRALREARVQQLNNDGSVRDGGSLQSAQQTLQSAQEVLDTLETPDKYRKLQDMKGRLQHLQEMVSDFQTDTESALPLLSIVEAQGNVASGNARMDQSRNSKGKNANKMKKTRNHKKDNISREHSNEYLARNLHDSRPPAPDVPGLHENAALPLWEEERQVQEKLSKLKSTKDKLAKIQDLLFTLQHTQIAGEPLSEGMTRQLLECMEEDSDGQAQVARAAGYHRFGEDSGGSKNQKHESGDKATASGDARNSYQDEQLFESQAEVDHLLDEGSKLMQMQEQFLKLKQQFTVNNSANAESRPVKSYGSREFLPPRASGGREKARTYSESSSKSNQDTSLPERQPSTLKNAMQNLALQKIAGESDDRDSELPFSNQELWSEMRQRLILKEELRQQKRELEELMKKDQGKLNSRNRDNMSDNLSYSNKSEGLGGSFGGTEGMTAATWGGSTQGNPDEDQDDQNESQEENDAADDNDAYSSEEVGLLEPDVAHRVQNHESFVSRNDAGAVQPCRNASEPVGGTDRLVNNAAPTLPKLVSEFQDARNFWEKSPQALPLPQNWSSQTLRLPVKQLVTGIEEPVEERLGGGSSAEFTPANWQQQALQFQHQIEQAHSLRQSLMLEQQNLSSLMHPTTNNLNISSGSTPPDSFRPFFPEVLQQYSQQLQQQQLIINLNQCYHLQYLQQLEIQQLQRQLQQVLHLHSASPLLPSDEAPRCNVSMSDEVATHSAPWLAPSPSTSQFAQCPAPIGPAETVVTSAHYPPTLMTQHSVSRGSEMLNNQVAPGMRANNYWDNFRSYSRQNLLSAASGNKSNGSGGAAAAPSLNAVGGNPQMPSAPMLPNRHLFQHQDILPERSALRSRNTQTSAPGAVASQTPSEQSVSSPNQQGSTFSIPKLELDRVATKVKQKKPKVNQEQQHPQRPALVGAATQTPTETFKPGQIIGGTAVLTNTSCSSSAMSLGSSVRGGDVSFLSDPLNHGTNVNESDDLSDRTLFDTLRESIYSEVANLISQNESRPHFLIQMFQQLQTLNSDYQRQNALIAVHELAHQVSEEGSPSSAPRRRRHGTIWIEPPANTTSEQTASESLMTSDDEEVRAHLFRANKVPPRYEPFSLKRSGEHTSNQDDRFLPLTLAEGRTNASTPPASSENPFASDSMADTVVCAVGKTKEVNQRKPFVHSGLGPDSSPARSASLPFHSPSEGNSSSAQDQISERSPSDIPYSGLNTSQLDDQIQAIMLEIIPFLKTHLDDMCSPKFLTYVRQLTLSLVTQRDEAGELTHFFRKQLSRILHDTLIKYSGRRLRECGEDLLVDMSEVLFNELAFLRLVQNMDSGTNIRARSARGSFQSMIQQTATSSSTNTSPQKGTLDEACGGNQPLFLPSFGLDAARDMATASTDATDADFTHVIRTEDDEVGQSHDDATSANCDVLTVDEGDDQNSNRVPKNQSLLRDDPTNDRNVTPVFGAVGLVTLDSALAANEHRELPTEEHNREMDVETEAEGLEEDLAEADRSQSHPVVERVASGGGPANIAEMNGNNSSELSHAEATEDDQGVQQEGAYGESEQFRNDECLACGETEQGLDEIPIKLRPLLQDLAQTRQQEEEMNNLVDEILNDSVEAELADTSSSVREPEHQ